mmetsp:Transcript_94817/g.267883  ORF Transcript_94817/g.267883 Transcript_94817/m.267883 type:complete len:245 (+) Transcript_94817:547-1281(+)
MPETTTEDTTRRADSGADATAGPGELLNRTTPASGNAVNGADTFGLISTASAAADSTATAVAAAAAALPLLRLAALLLVRGRRRGGRGSRGGSRRGPTWQNCRSLVRLLLLLGRRCTRPAGGMREVPEVPGNRGLLGCATSLRRLKALSSRLALLLELRRDRRRHLGHDTTHLGRGLRRRRRRRARRKDLFLVDLPLLVLVLLAFIPEAVLGVQLLDSRLLPDAGRDLRADALRHVHDGAAPRA